MGQKQQAGSPPLSCSAGRMSIKVDGVVRVSDDVVLSKLEI